jgi:hypothetical protein
MPWDIALANTTSDVRDRGRFLISVEFFGVFEPENNFSKVSVMQRCSSLDNNLGNTIKTRNQS